VAVACRRQGEAAHDVHIAARTPLPDAIGAVFGSGVKRELLPLEVSAQEEEGAAHDGKGAGAALSTASTLLSSAAGGGGVASAGLRFRCSGYVTNGSYSSKRGGCVLFVNGRLVDVPALRKGVEGVYGGILPKGGHPFAYLSLTLPPSHIDVNVHPTKREVALLHEDGIVGAVLAALRGVLAGANASRTFAAQPVLSLAQLLPAGPDEEEEAAAAGGRGTGHSHISGGAGGGAASGTLHTTRGYGSASSASSATSASLSGSGSRASGASSAVATAPSSRHGRRGIDAALSTHAALAGDADGADILRIPDAAALGRADSAGDSAGSSAGGGAAADEEGAQGGGSLSVPSGAGSRKLRQAAAATAGSRGLAGVGPDDNDEDEEDADASAHGRSADAEAQSGSSAAGGANGAMVEDENEDGYGGYGGGGGYEQLDEAAVAGSDAGAGVSRSGRPSGRSLQQSALAYASASDASAGAGSAASAGGRQGSGRQPLPAKAPKKAVRVDAAQASIVGYLAQGAAGAGAGAGAGAADSASARESGEGARADRSGGGVGAAAALGGGRRDGRAVGRANGLVTRDLGGTDDDEDDDAVGSEGEGDAGVKEVEVEEGGDADAVVQVGDADAADDSAADYVRASRGAGSSRRDGAAGPRPAKRRRLAEGAEGSCGDGCGGVSEGLDEGAGGHDPHADVVALDASGCLDDENGYGAGSAAGDIPMMAAGSVAGQSQRKRPRASAQAAQPARPKQQARRRQRERASDAEQLTSVQELRASVAAEEHAGIAAILRRHVYVGLVDRHRSLLQHSTKLLLVNHSQLARELFYQQALRLFGCAPPVRLSPPVDVRQAVMLALRARRPLTRAVKGDGGAAEAAGGDGGEEDGDDPVADAEEAGVADEVCALLQSKAAMVAEYFSIRLEGSDDGEEDGAAAAAEVHEMAAGQDAAGEAQPQQRLLLTHLPRLLDHHAPFMPCLPDFLLSLAFDVDWGAEKPCFHSIAQAVAAFYAELPPPMPYPDDGGEDGGADAAAGGSGSGGGGGSSRAEASMAAGEDGEAGSALVGDSSSGSSSGGAGGSSSGPAPVCPFRSDSAAYRAHPSSPHFIVGCVLFPALRAGLVPPRRLALAHHVVQLACTEQLYRIFERC
jgi:hypothetical protein